MRSHLAGILIAGLMLMPLYRLTPAGMPDGPGLWSGPVPPCLTDAEPGACCPGPEGSPAGTPGAPEPGGTCPPLCCTAPPAIALALPEIPPAEAPEPRRLFPRARDELAGSRHLAPEPPVPIS